MTRFTSLLRTLALTSAIAGAASAANYPIAADGTINVNLMRKYGQTGLLTTFQNINGPGVGTSSTRPISGDQWMMQWNAPAANDPTATATLRFTLDQAVSIGKFVHPYNDPSQTPASYVIRTSTTGFGSMTTAVAQPVGSTAFDLLGTPVTAQYIEYQWTGTTASQFVLMKEFEAYADAASGPINDRQGFDIISNGLATITDATVDVDNPGTPGINEAGGWKSIDSLSDVIDRAVPGNPGSYHLDSLLRGKDNDGVDVTGDARFLVDLHDTYALTAVNLGFFHGQFWGSGAKIEVSGDGVNFATVFDTHSSVDLVNAVFDHHTTRFIRVTNYNSTGGALVEIQAFVPEPASLALLAMGGVMGTARRRRA